MVLVELATLAGLVVVLLAVLLAIDEAASVFVEEIETIDE